MKLQIPDPVSRVGTDCLIVNLLPHDLHFRSLLRPIVSVFRYPLGAVFVPLQ